MNRLLDVDTCKYAGSSSELHPLYFKTQMKDSDYQIYKSSNIYDSIRNKVPDLSDTLLQQNYHNVYYRTFSQWSKSCQSAYPTQEVATYFDYAGKLNEEVDSMILYGTILLVACIFAIALAVKFKKV